MPEHTCEIETPEPKQKARALCPPSWSNWGKWAAVVPLRVVGERTAAYVVQRTLYCWLGVTGRRRSVGAIGRRP